MHTKEEKKFNNNMKEIHIIMCYVMCICMLEIIHSHNRYIGHKMKQK